jgi:PIN domain nuclease of toxin-antitoxin system
MNYLIDTHTLLWITADDLKLSENAKKIYLNDENEIFLSMASIWELAIKSSIKKISFDTTIEDYIEKHVRNNNIKILDIGLSHIIRVETLPFHHRDPFDRLIIAQAIEENLPIISKDSFFDKYEIQRKW